MGDEDLARELARTLHAAVDGKDCDCTPGARYEFLVSARAALAWLAERGRLVPNGAEVEEQWGVRWPHDRPDVLREYMMYPRRSVAEAYIAMAARSQLVYSDGHQPRLDGRLVRRQVITTPWAPVGDAPTPSEAGSGQRGRDEGAP